MPVLNPASLIEDRVTAIRNLHERVGILRAQLDVSGGIDSGVMLGLLARAVGPENIVAVYSSIHSGDEFGERARMAAEAFKVKLIEIDLTSIFDGLVGMMDESLVKVGYDREELEAHIRRDRTVLGSLRSCLRAPVGRGFNRMAGGGIRHGTGNECEDRFIRFYQKGGDGEVDTNPIGMLGKGEVYQLAKGLGVPRALVDAMPSPDLHGIGNDHNDEDELRALTGVEWTYSRIDFESGEYTKVGTIERMSRYLDQGHEEVLFGNETPDEGTFRRMAEEARGDFPGLEVAEIDGLLRSARRMEATSRHKMNPNIPMLGDRESLVQAGVLSNELPEV